MTSLFYGLIVAIFALLTLLVLSTYPTQAIIQSDIVIDGEFSDWSDETGNEICQIDENGATDVNHLYQYQFDRNVQYGKGCFADDARTRSWSDYQYFIYGRYSC